MVILLTAAFLGQGCANRDREERTNRPAPARQVVVVPPVINLSGSGDFDPLRFTDLVASELVASADVAVVPVNLTLAALTQDGKQWVETPEDALRLAESLGADGTLLVAVTEYDPYDPPVVGLVMQWYARPARGARPLSLDPVAASRRADGEIYELSAEHAVAGQPRVQLQRVFNAASNDVLQEVQEYADGRDGHRSPLGWRRYTKSQELYVRYCCWSLIRSMQGLTEWQVSALKPNEAKR